MTKEMKANRRAEKHGRGWGKGEGASMKLTRLRPDSVRHDGVPTMDQPIKPLELFRLLVDNEGSFRVHPR